MVRFGAMSQAQRPLRDWRPLWDWRPLLACVDLHRLLVKFSLDQWLNSGSGAAPGWAIDPIWTPQHPRVLTQLSFFPCQLPGNDGGPEPRPHVPAGCQWPEPILRLPVANCASKHCLHRELQPQHAPTHPPAAPQYPLGLPPCSFCLPCTLGRGSAPACAALSPTSATQHHLPAVWDLPCGGHALPTFR